MAEEQKSGSLKRATAHEEHYDPCDHREPKRPISSAGAFILITKGAIGTGIISSSLIFKSGWLTGILYTCLIGVLLTHCLHILIRSQYRLCRRLKVPALGYSESVKRALEHGPPRLRFLNKYASVLVDSSLLLGQFAICTTYALFVLQTFGFFEEYTMWLNIGLKRYVYCLLLMIPTVFILFMGNWKIAIGFSAAANLISIIPFFIVFSYLIEDQRPLDQLTAVGDIYQLPLFFGPVLFALESVAVVSSFENNLKSPKQFISRWGALNIGMIVITSIYILIGCFGYWRFGEYSIGSFLNDLPLRDSASMWCRALYTLVIYLSYGLHGFVLVELLWRKKSRGHDLKFKHIFRVAFVVGTTLIITLVPFIIRTVILNAMFAVSLPVLGIILPALIEFCVEWPTHHARRNLILWKNTILIILGIIDIIAVLYFCVQQLQQFFGRRRVLFW